MPPVIRSTDTIVFSWGLKSDKRFSTLNRDTFQRGSPGGSVQLLSSVRLFEIPRTAARQLLELSIANSQSLLKLLSIESVMPSNVSSSVIPFSSCLQSFPASGSFQMSHFFASGGQSIGVSASSTILPMNIQDWFPLGWTGSVVKNPSVNAGDPGWFLGQDPLEEEMATHSSILA